MLIGTTRDTFTGAYASEYLRQKVEKRWDIKSAIIRSNKAAAITIQRVGSQDGIPWADEIENFDAPPKVIDPPWSNSTPAIILADRALI